MKLLHCQIVCVRATVFLYSHELKFVDMEVRTETNSYCQVVFVQACMAQ